MGGCRTSGEDRIRKGGQRSSQHNARPEEAITSEVLGEAKGDRSERVLVREEDEPINRVDKIRWRGR